MGRLGSGNQNSSNNSKQGLAVDTTSRQSLPGTNRSGEGETPNQRPSQGGRQVGARSNASLARSQNDESIPTPRDLHSNKNSQGSGKQLADQKRSVDDMQKAKTIDDKELGEHAQSATQSQQFKTLDESKSQLIQESNSANRDMVLKQGLVNKQSNNSQQSKEKKSQNQSQPEMGAPVADAIQDSDGQIFVKEVSDPAINIKNEIIEEKPAEYEDEERKTNLNRDGGITSG